MKKHLVQDHGRAARFAVKRVLHYSRRYPVKVQMGRAPVISFEGRAKFIAELAKSSIQNKSIALAFASEQFRGYYNQYLIQRKLSQSDPVAIGTINKIAKLAMRRAGISNKAAAVEHLDAIMASLVLQGNAVRDYSKRLIGSKQGLTGERKKLLINFVNDRVSNDLNLLHSFLYFAALLIKSNKVDLMPFRERKI